MVVFTMKQVVYLSATRTSRIYLSMVRPAVRSIYMIKHATAHVG